MAIGLQGSLGTIFFDQLPSTFKVARLLEAANLNLKASALVSNSFAKQLVRKVNKFWRLFGLSESARKAYALDSKRAYGENGAIDLEQFSVLSCLANLS